MLPSLFSAGRISFGIFLPHALFLVKFCSRLVLLMVWGGCSCGSTTDALWEGGAAGDDRHRKDPQWMMSLGNHRMSLWPLYILSMLCLLDLRTSYAWESHQYPQDHQSLFPMYGIILLELYVSISCSEDRCALVESTKESWHKCKVLKTYQITHSLHICPIAICISLLPMGLQQARFATHSFKIRSCPALTAACVGNFKESGWSIS